MLDGLVLARSGFHHSMNYRAVMALGRAELVEGDHKLHALKMFSDRLVPGRWETLRPPTTQELKATTILRLELTEASAKIRTGQPVDDDEDYALPVWAGVLPLSVIAGAPIPDPRLAPGTPLPANIASSRPKSDMTTIYDKAERFAALHREGCFVIANAWDAGSARILAGQGFSAIRHHLRRPRFHAGPPRRSRQRVPGGGAGHCGRHRRVNGLSYVGRSGGRLRRLPEDCAATVRLAANAGLCGCTIEDTTADPAAPIHVFDTAVARIAPPARAARSVTHPFILTARAENFLHGRPDLDDTIRRLVAFAEAGADCLYAPALPDMDAIRAVVAAVSPKPVNVLSGPRDGLVPLSTLAAAGVRRISVGGALARAAYGQVMAAGHLLRDGDLPAPYTASPPTQRWKPRSLPANSSAAAEAWRSWLGLCPCIQPGGCAVITCFIRYEIDPFKKPAFEEYAAIGARRSHVAAPTSSAISPARGLRHHRIRHLQH